MPRTGAAVLLISLLGAGWCTAAAESPLDRWHVFGSNTLRASYYDTRGLAAASPYPFTGDMYYDELNLYFMRQDSPYDFWRGEFSGLYNIADDYRSDENGPVPERINLTRESGSAALPYRLELGDHFAYLSYLTLQRSLKGLRWELQPPSTVDGRRHSIVFISGLDQHNWRDLAVRDDYTNAFSWLLEDVRLGAFGVNLTQNFRGGSPTLGTLDRNQFVVSLVGEKPFRLGDQDLVLEGEWARFSGDHDGSTDAPSGQGVSDTGAFLQLSGLSRSLPWDYQLRLQYYGRDFRPRGGVITPDRRSVEGFSGWRFDSGVLMRLRAQYFEDAAESANPLDTRTAGVNFAGPLLAPWWPEVSGSLDLFVQEVEDRSRTIDQFSQTFNLNLSKPLPAGWTGHLGLFLQNIDDSGLANADRRTGELRLAADHGFRIGDVDGYISPGVVLRALRRGGNDSNDVNPTLAMQLMRGPHTLRADYGYLAQNRLPLGSIDVQTHLLNLDYSYARRRHVLGLEANLFARSPEPGASTDAYRVSVFWTYHFDKPPAAVAAPLPATLAAAPATAPALDLAALAPGLERTAAEALLAEGRVPAGAPVGGFTVMEYPWLREIMQRQRLVLEYRADVLERAAVIIDFEPVGDPETARQTFERIRQQLIRRYGNPLRSYDDGEFGPDFARAVNEQRLLRLSEWQLADGSLLRFGMPRRLDGQVRMEIHHARSFPPPGESRWSLEPIR